MSLSPSVSSSSFLAALPLPARSHVIDALELRDVVQLLSCSRALRNDTETASLALRGYNITCHFGRGCTLDWCLPVPALFLSDALEQEICALDHADEPPLPWETHGDTCAKLLSLAGHVGFVLNDVLYQNFEAGSVVYTALPFVWPTASPSPQPDAELEEEQDLAYQVSDLQLEPQNKEGETTAREQATSSRVTPLSLHFNNIDTEGTDAWCAFCDMVETQVDKYTLDGFGYLVNRDASVWAAGEQLRAAGHDENSDEWAATIAYYERMDALYDQDVIDEEDAPEIMRRLIECDELPPLHGMEALARDDNADIADESAFIAVGDAVGDAAHAGFTDHTCRELCRPARRFFETSGFRDVRHEIVEAHSPIVEMIEKFSGVAPCGFVTGLMISSVPISN